MIPDRISPQPKKPKENKCKVKFRRDAQGRVIEQSTEGCNEKQLRALRGLKDSEIDGD